MVSAVRRGADEFLEASNKSLNPFNPDIGGATFTIKNFSAANLTAEDFIFLSEDGKPHPTPDPADVAPEPSVGAGAIVGTVGSDTLNGTQSANVIRGEGGDDRIDGKGDDDVLYGGAGNDRLEGGTGNDLLRGGAGNDVLTGGAGSDKFVFAGRFGIDRIKDFTDGEDVIDLSDLGGFQDVNAHQAGEDVVLQIAERGAGGVVLENFDLADLDSSDFLF